MTGRPVDLALSFGIHHSLFDIRYSGMTCAHGSERTIWVAGIARAVSSVVRIQFRAILSFRGSKARRTPGRPSSGHDQAPAATSSSSPPAPLEHREPQNAGRSLTPRSPFRSSSLVFGHGRLLHNSVGQTFLSARIVFESLLRHGAGADRNACPTKAGFPVPCRYRVFAGV